MIRKLSLHALAAAFGIAYFVAFYELAARSARHQPRPTAQQITVAP